MLIFNQWNKYILQCVCFENVAKWNPCKKRVQSFKARFYQTLFNALRILNKFCRY